MIVRRPYKSFGPLGRGFGQVEPDLDVKVKPSTAVAGLGLWVLGGVLTHLAIRFIDGWLDQPRRK